jgi:ATP-dependent HslUV protease, peptidase subunit HslV
VRRDGKVVLAGDGQVTLGRIGDQAHGEEDSPALQRQDPGWVCGSTADAFTLFSRFEAKLEQYHGNLGRAAVELAKDWRTDKFLRHLEALLLVCDKEQTFLLSGQGDVIEPDGEVAAIGSGGPYAQAAAQALSGAHPANRPPDRRRSDEDCGQNVHLYTNDQVTIEEL